MEQDSQSSSAHTPGCRLIRPTITWKECHCVAILSKDWDLSGFNGIACARSWRLNRTRRARPLVTLACWQTTRARRAHPLIPQAVAWFALLSHERNATAWLLFLRSHVRVGHHIKRLNEKIPADVSQQGFIWIYLPSLCGIPAMEQDSQSSSAHTPGCRLIRPTSTWKECHCVATLSSFPCSSWSSRQSRNNEKIPALLSKDWDLSFIRRLAMTYSHMGRPHTTIGAIAFHCWVRNGIRWYHNAMVAKQKLFKA
jgi:hypothetical protein